MKEKMIQDFDVLIIGAGPAGLTAAIYLARNNVKVLVIEGTNPGGKLAEQSKIENYPGFNSISGVDLAFSMYNQAKLQGTSFVFSKVTSLESNEKNWKILTLENGKIYYAPFAIVATGMQNLVPTQVKNIEKFNHKGVSYCVVCDGTLYKDKPTAIIGGGNSAFEEGLYLSALASEVHIFVRDGIIAEKSIVEKVRAQKNMFIHENSVILEILGTNKVEKIKASIDNKIVEMKIDAVFPYIGFKPATSFISNKTLLDSKGFIVVNKNMETKEPNLFAIGDVIEKTVRQITTATNDGTIAAKLINLKIS